MEIKSKPLDEINEITYDTKTGITTTTLVHTIDFEKYKKIYGGESKIFKILLEELKNKDNIIDELEKWLEENKKISQAHENVLGVNISNLVLDKLKELKDSKMNE